MKILNFKFQISNSKKGFTLVELAIYMGISMVILLTLTELLAAIINTKLTTQATTGIGQDGRYIYTRFIYDINRADSVSVPAILGDTSSSLVFIVNGTEYSYGIQNGNLVLSDPQDPERLNGVDTQISNLAFKRIGNINGKHTFRISYVITSKVVDKGAAKAESFQTTAGLR